MYTLQHLSFHSTHTYARPYALQSTCIYIHMYMYMNIPYIGYFSGGKIFVSSEILASLWKYFRGRGILNHTPVLCDTVSRVKNSWSRFASQPRKFYPPKNTRYTVPSTHSLVSKSQTVTHRCLILRRVTSGSGDL